MMESKCIQCPECGGEIVLDQGAKYSRCSFCGNEFACSSPDFKKRLSLVAQANFCRRRGDFEGAELLYGDLIKLDESDPNNYWGLVLTAYGIEYVFDPRTARAELTCRRTETRSIYENKNYQMALAKSDGAKQERYRQDAARIDAIVQKIKQRLKYEQPYDVFICFKSTDENDAPTEERAIARRIYDELTRRGIKTFFSEVSLKGRLGSDYEPIIYNAIYSASVMILVATKEEHINSIWVRNEWTRFRDRIHEENLRDASFAVFRDIPRTSLPPVFRAQGVDLKKYPFGGYEIEIADALSKRLLPNSSQNPQSSFANPQNNTNPQANSYAQNNTNPNQANSYAQNNTNPNQANSYAQNNAGTQNQARSYASMQQRAGANGQNFAMRDSENAEQAEQRNRPKNFADRAFHSRERVDSGLSREAVNRELAILIKEKHQQQKLKQHAEDAYNVTRATMKRMADQRKEIVAGKDKVDKILATPDYFRKKARRRANSVLWLRLLLTVLLVVLAVAFVHPRWIVVASITCGVLIIWYRQFIPTSSRSISKKELICKERQQQLHEQIIQCEMQLATLNRKFDKSRQEMSEADKRIRQYEATLQEYQKVYPYAAKQIEKINTSTAHKVANKVSEGIIAIAGGIDKGITSVKDSLFKNNGE